MKSDGLVTIVSVLKATNSIRDFIKTQDYKSPYSFFTSWWNSFASFHLSAGVHSCGCLVNRN